MHSAVCSAKSHISFCHFIKLIVISKIKNTRFVSVFDKLGSLNASFPWKKKKIKQRNYFDFLTIFADSKPIWMQTMKSEESSHDGSMFLQFLHSVEEKKLIFIADIKQWWTFWSVTEDDGIAHDPNSKILKRPKTQETNNK